MDGHQPLNTIDVILAYPANPKMKKLLGFSHISRKLVRNLHLAEVFTTRSWRWRLAALSKWIRRNGGRRRKKNGYFVLLETMHVQRNDVALRCAIPCIYSTGSPHFHRRTNTTWRALYEIEDLASGPRHCTDVLFSVFATHTIVYCVLIFAFWVVLRSVLSRLVGYDHGWIIFHRHTDWPL